MAVKLLLLAHVLPFQNSMTSFATACASFVQLDMWHVLLAYVAGICLHA